MSDPGPRWVWILVGALGLAALSTWGAVRYSESPRFCRSCHIMEPYYNAWNHSKHNTVACVECHYPPGTPRTLLWKKFQALSQVAKYVTRTYSSKPFAEIEDASCLRSGCHSARLLQGRVMSARGIKFDHQPHLLQTRRGRQLRCVSCHSQIVVGNHVEVTYDTCYLCHFKGRGSGRDLKPLAGCLACHDLPSKTFQIANMAYNHKDFVTRQGLSCANCHVDVVRGEGAAPQERCFTCHNQPEKLARYGDIPFLHENHVTRHNIACFHCHQRMAHGFASNGEPVRLAEAGVGVSSVAARARPRVLAFDCSFCHEAKHDGQMMMYTGKAGALGLPELPSPMFSANVGCIGCHYAEKKDGAEAEFRGVNFRASDHACVKCHGGRFAGVWEETKGELAAALEKLGAKAEAAAAALEKAPPEARPALSARLAHAERLRHFVRASRGEHNVYLAALALRRADEELSTLGEAAKSELPDLSGLPLLSGGFCATLCHEKVGVKVPPETVTAFGKTMPHKEHAGMMGCVKCHDIGAHKRVPLRKAVREQVCAGCHP